MGVGERHEEGEGRGDKVDCGVFDVSFPISRGFGIGWFILRLGRNAAEAVAGRFGGSSFFPTFSELGTGWIVQLGK